VPPKQFKKNAETTKSKSRKENIDNEKTTKSKKAKKDEENNVIFLLIENDRFGHRSDQKVQSHKTNQSKRCWQYHSNEARGRTSKD
jgi:hypothetical protein